MPFVGRRSEKKKIIKALNHGKNIILTGKYGMGRTYLIKEIAKAFSEERKFIFVDFSLTPGQMSERLIKALGIPRRLKNQGNKMSYKSMRYRIASTNTSKQHRPVIVFDNIAKITVQKKIFLRHLILEQHFQFIAIAENFLSQKDLFDLMAQLMPATTLKLRHLKNEDVKKLLSIYNKQYHFSWTDSHIHNLAAMSDGYPLELAEMFGKQISSPKPVRHIQ